MPILVFSGYAYRDGEPLGGVRVRVYPVNADGSLGSSFLETSSASGSGYWQLSVDTSVLPSPTGRYDIELFDAMTGQDAVNIATHFNESLDVTGVILTKLDGDARGGAVLSIRYVTGKPIKLLGMGEKLDQMEPFFPDRMASRILGMGDVVTLVEKAQAAVKEEEAKAFARKIKEESLTLEDFLDQLQKVKQMGPLQELLNMIPGFGTKVEGLEVEETQMKKIEAMIQSMTREERRNPDIIDGSRRQRIAKGSATSPHDINQLLKQFRFMKKMLKQMSTTSPFRMGLPKGLPVGVLKKGKRK